MALGDAYDVYKICDFKFVCDIFGWLEYENKNTLWNWYYITQVHIYVVGVLAAINQCGQISEECE